MDFPGDVWTNAILFQGSSVIAFAIVGARENIQDGPDIKSPVDRLYQVQADLLDDEILTAVDPNVPELFTFWRKEDLQSDPKATSKRVLPLARQYQCFPVAHKLLKAEEYRKPSNVRLYALLMTAIIQRATRVFALDTNHLGLDVGRFLFRQSRSSNKWSVVNVNAQGLPDNAVLAMATVDTSVSLQQIGTLTTSERAALPALTKVLLARAGFYARYRCSTISPGPMGETTKDPAPLMLETWKHQLAVSLSHQIDLEEEWLELELPIRDETEPIKWKTIFWPASLCLIPDTYPQKREDITNTSDPLEFVESWVASGIVSEQRLQKLDAELDSKPTTQISDLPRRVTSVDGQAALIYPTPPDGTLSQVTEGGDSIAATPGTQIPRGAADVEILQDITIGSGLYDEDLFEDMAGEKFGAAEMAAEPNWDFFDEPDEVRPDIEMDLDPPKTNMDETLESQESAQKLDVLPESPELPKMEEGQKTPEIIQTVTGPPVPEIQVMHLDEPLSPDAVRQKLFSDPLVGSAGWLKSQNMADSGRRSLLGGDNMSPLFHPQLKNVDTNYESTGSFWFDSRKSKDGTKASGVPKIGIPLATPCSPSSSSHSTDNDIVEDPEVIQPVQESDTDVIDPLQRQATMDEVESLVDLLRPQLDESPTTAHFDFHSPTCPAQIDNKNLTIVAQVLARQVAGSIFPHPQNQTQTQLLSTDSTHKPLFGQMQAIFGPASDMKLSKFADMLDGDGPFDLDDSAPPFIRVSRGDIPLEARPTIQAFWEALGLQPVHGRKNVTAICIHPTGRNIEEGSLTMLNRMAETYSNCNLGTHVPRLGLGMTKNGLVEWSAPAEDMMERLMKICEVLGPMLAEPETDNVLVYIVNPFSDPAAYADICAAFIRFWGAYQKSRGRHPAPEPKLRIIPASFVASAKTVAIPNQADYLALALSVYNQCHLKDVTVARSEAAVALAKPGMGDVVLTLGPSPLNSDILHLAYSQSRDQRWISASWSDLRGETSLTMTYCLGPKGSDLRPRREVLKELWEISADIMASNSKWELVVAHHGPMSADEQSEWTDLQTKAAGVPCSLNLLTFDENPALQFDCSAFVKARSAVGIKQTPVSTPVAAAVASPEQTATPIPPTPTASGFLAAPTPPDHSQIQDLVDPDLTLVDSVDECWSVVLPFGLNNSHTSLEYRPARASGCLLKRGGPLDSDGLVSLGVNILSTQPEQSPSEDGSLLKKVMGQYRALHTLTTTKGLGSQRELLPWHIRNAIIGCRAVAAVL